MKLINKKFRKLKKKRKRHVIILHSFITQICLHPHLIITHTNTPLFYLISSLTFDIQPYQFFSGLVMFVDQFSVFFLINPSVHCIALCLEPHEINPLRLTSTIALHFGSFVLFQQFEIFCSRHHEIEILL